MRKIVLRLNVVKWEGENTVEVVRALGTPPYQIDGDGRLSLFHGQEQCIKVEQGDTIYFDEERNRIFVNLL